MDRLDAFLEELKQESRDFVEGSLWSVILTGSLARRDLHVKDVEEVDIILVAGGYDLGSRRRFKTMMEMKWPGIHFDTGIYPMDRLTREKSLSLYDIKNNGVVLAGRDVRDDIPEIKPADLFPYEGFRLLLNRAIEVIGSIQGVEDGRLRFDPEKYRTALRRFDGAARDAALIFSLRFHPSPVARESMYLDTFGRDRPTGDLEGVRREFLEVMDLGLERGGFFDVQDLVESMAETFSYPMNFRFYTLLKTGRMGALQRNPVLRAYEEVYRYFQQPVSTWDAREAGVLVGLKENSPQPLLVKR